MARFLIFPYIHENIQYVDAYPIDARPLSVVDAAPIQRVIVNTPTRNQARREAWKLWIDIDCKEFNKSPRSYRERDRRRR